MNSIIPSFRLINESQFSDEQILRNIESVYRSLRLKTRNIIFHASSDLEFMFPLTGEKNKIFEHRGKTIQYIHKPHEIYLFVHPGMKYPRKTRNYTGVELSFSGPFEAMQHLIAHELRHIWQSETGNYFEHSWRERDANYFAAQFLKNNYE